MQNYLLPRKAYWEVAMNHVEKAGNLSYGFMTLQGLKPFKFES